MLLPKAKTKREVEHQEFASEQVRIYEKITQAKTELDTYINQRFDNGQVGKTSYRKINPFHKSQGNSLFIALLL